MLPLRLLTIPMLATTAFAADLTTFRDPLEQAFTVDVPQGWTVKGGAIRMGYSDVRVMVDMTSPDGRTNIRLGDVAIPAYFVPNQFHPNEGEIYDLGAQAQMTVARYRTGDQYAALYSAVRFKESCGHPVSRAADAGPALDFPEMPKSSMGQAAFRCDGNRATLVYAGTAMNQGFWTVSALVSYIAPADQTAAVRAVAARSVASMKILPAWRERQKKMDEEALVYQRARQQQRRREISQQVAQFEMKMQAMRNQVARFEAGQARQASQFQEMDDAINGVTRVTDPLGNPKTVWTGTKSRYWTNGLGQVINSDTSPGPGWKEMPQQK